MEWISWRLLIEVYRTEIQSFERNGLTKVKLRRPPHVDVTVAELLQSRWNVQLSLSCAGNHTVLHLSLQP